MRYPVLIVALLFVLAMGAFTARDLATHGVTLVGVAAAVIVVMLGVGLVGALFEPPQK